MGHIVKLVDGHMVYDGLLSSKEKASIDDILHALQEEIPTIEADMKAEYGQSVWYKYNLSLFLSSLLEKYEISVSERRRFWDEIKHFATKEERKRDEGANSVTRSFYQQCYILSQQDKDVVEKLTWRQWQDKSVAIMLQEWKEKQEEAKEVLGSEYQDFNLVMATTFGHPTDGAAIRNDLKKLIREYDLPPVVFHSLRHTSVTYKLKLNGGDIKAVQGDSGHAQVNMVTDVYSHILDDDRKKNAELFEDVFYGKKEADPQMHRKKSENTLKVPDGVDAELLAKVLSNPEMAALLASLAKTLN